MMRSIVFTLLTLLLLAACSKDKRLEKDLNEKEWSIETSKRWVIYNDGTTLLYEDLENAGSIFIRNDPSSSLSRTYEVRMVYTNFLGTGTDFTTALYTDEKGKRVGMANVLCTSPFMCDLVWTVEKSSGARQTWSAYGSDDVFFFPPDLYSANKDHHLKWEITLKKEGKYE